MSAQLCAKDNGTTAVEEHDLFTTCAVMMSAWLAMAVGTVYAYIGEPFVDAADCTVNALFP